MSSRTIWGQIRLFNNPKRHAPLRYSDPPPSFHARGSEATRQSNPTVHLKIQRLGFSRSIQADAPRPLLIPYQNPPPLPAPRPRPSSSPPLLAQPPLFPSSPSIFGFCLVMVILTPDFCGFFFFLKKKENFMEFFWCAFCSFWGV